MADWGVCISANDRSNITVKSTVFYQNTAYKSGGAIHISDESYIAIINSSFRENESLEEGGILVLENTAT